MFSKQYISSLKNFFQLNLAGLSRKPTLPRLVVFLCTSLCNLRCVMCGIWRGSDTEKREKDLTVSEIERIFSNKFFSEVESINIQGGEPSMREDINEISEILISKMPKLKGLSFTTNGFAPDLLLPTVDTVLKQCQKKDIRLSVSISIDGVGSVHDNIRGRGSFKNIEKSIEGLKILQKKTPFIMTTNCVISPLNVEHLSELIAWRSSQGLKGKFALVECRDRFMNSKQKEKLHFSKNQKIQLSHFLKQLSIPTDFEQIDAFRYSNLLGMLNENKFRMCSCKYLMYATLLGSNGEMYFCPISKQIGNCRDRSPYEIYFHPENLFYRHGVLQENCRSCFPYNYNRLERDKDFIPYLLFYVRSVMVKRLNSQNRQQ